MSLLRRRSKGRSCTLHGDNGCEIQGEAGPRERVHDKRAWAADVRSEIFEHIEIAREAFELGKRIHGADLGKMRRFSSRHCQ